MGPPSACKETKEYPRVHPEPHSCRWDDGYAKEQLRQRHQNLESLDFEYQSTRYDPLRIPQLSPLTAAGDR